MLLRPGPATNEAVLGVLARAVARTGVKLHAFVVVSNHVHLLVTAVGDALSRFMQYFLCNTSKKVGRLVDWTGGLWERRFSAQPVLDDEAATRTLRYIVSHGVKEGLVRKPEDWPGLTCVALLRSGGAHVTRFFSWARRWRNGKLREGGEALWDERWVEAGELTLAPLPAWESLPQSQREAMVDQLLADIEAEFHPLHATVAGRERVLAQDPHHRPVEPKRAPAAAAICSNRDRAKRFAEELREFVTAYADASRRFRCGDWTADFPRWACRPAVPFAGLRTHEMHERDSKSA